MHAALPGLGALGGFGALSRETKEKNIYDEESDCAGWVGEDGHDRLFASGSFIRVFWGYPAMPMLFIPPV